MFNRHFILFFILFYFFCFWSRSSIYSQVELQSPKTQRPSQAMFPSSSACVTQAQVESYVFPPRVKPPGSANTLFLGGAGPRSLVIDGEEINFTAIGVYLEDNAIPSLAVKWKANSAEELTESVEFFSDIVQGPFEKFTRVTMILPLTGKQYSEKVAENCVAFLKAVGTYTDAEDNAIEKFLNVFKDQIFPPGSSILFTLSPVGSLMISFSKDDSIPELWNAVIESKLLSEAVLESIIGKHGVSPATKKNLAVRLSDLLKHCSNEAADNFKLESKKAVDPETLLQLQNDDGIKVAKAGSGGL